MKRPSKAELQEAYNRIQVADQRALVDAAVQKELLNQSLALEAKRSATTGVFKTWNEPPPSSYNYERASREAYGGNEIVYICIEELCGSASEPVIVAYDGKEQLESHPVLDLLEKPNPFLTGHDYIATQILYRSIAGNSYTEMVYGNGTTYPVELWPVRPDRIEIIPDPVDTIRAYRFKFGNITHDFEPYEIGHYKTRNPLSQFYGLPPLSVLYSRVDTDNYGKEFTKAFFFNAGVPQTLLAFKQLLDETERGMISSRFNRGYGGAAGWHGVMITEQNELDVKQLGLPMGQRGIAYPELDEINEARLAMVFGVPLSLIGARLGQKSGSYANKKSDREMFWNETLVPIYRELEASFNQWLVPKFSGVTHIKFDLTTVHAFGDETDILHARWRNNLTQGMAGWLESRRAIGLNAEPDDNDIIMVPQNLVPVLYKDFKVGHMPEPALPVQGQLGDQRNENGADRRPYVPSKNGNGNHAYPH